MWRVTRAACNLASRQGLFLTLAHIGLIMLLVRGDGGSVQAAALVSVLNSPATLIQQYSLAVLQGLTRFRAFNVVRLLPSVGYAVLAAGAWAAGAGSLMGITLAWTAASVGAAFVSAAVTYRVLREHTPDAASRDGRTSAYKEGLKRRMVVFGRKAVIASASPVETLRMDQAAVGIFLSPMALGLYVTAVAFTNLPRFVAQSIGIVAFPHVAARPTESAARHTLWRFVALTAAVCAVMVGVIEAAVGWLLPALFGGSFADAVPVAHVLLIGAFFVSMRRVLSDAARGIGLPGAGTIAECVSWVGLGLLLPFAIPHGLTYVAWAIVASSVVSCAVLITLVWRGRKPGRPWAKAAPPEVTAPGALDVAGN